MDWCGSGQGWGSGSLGFWPEIGEDRKEESLVLGGECHLEGARIVTSKKENSVWRTLLAISCQLVSHQFTHK